MSQKLPSYHKDTRSVKRTMVFQKISYTQFPQIFGNVPFILPNIVKCSKIVLYRLIKSMCSKLCEN